MVNKLQKFVEWDLMIITRVQHVNPEMSVPQSCKSLAIAQHVHGSFIAF